MALVILLGASPLLGQQFGATTVRWGNPALEKDCCANFMQDGNLVTTYQDANISYFTVLHLDLDDKYFMVYIGVRNNADVPVTIYPENFRFRFMDPINKGITALDAASVIKEIGKRGGTTRFLRNVFAGMARNRTTVDGSTLGSVSIYDNRGNSANGTYSSQSSATISSPDLEARAEAREKNREDKQKNESRASTFNRFALRAHTLAKGESKEGIVFFRKEKFSAGTVLSFTIGQVTYEVPYGSERLSTANEKPAAGSTATAVPETIPQTGSPVLQAAPTPGVQDQNVVEPAGKKVPTPSPTAKAQPTVSEPLPDSKPDPIAGDDSRVSIRSAPDGAEIEVDGHFLGSTPSSFPLPVGEHKVVLKKSGFAPWERAISIRRGGDITISATLDAATVGQTPRIEGGDKTSIPSGSTRTDKSAANQGAGGPPPQIPQVRTNVDVVRTPEPSDPATGNAGAVSTTPARNAQTEPQETEHPPTSMPGATRKGAVGIDLVWIPPGEFTMGTISGGKNERPAHTVRISQGFWMSKYEITQLQWFTETGQNPSDFRNCGSVCPVDSVTWEEAKGFVERLNAKNDGFMYSLPTEAEWEYAARGGKTSSQPNLDENGWYARNSNGSTRPVGTKRPNGFGLYDMTGNLWEWCEDWYADYTIATDTDPRGPLSGTRKVLRGGSWRDKAELTTPTARVSQPTRTRYRDMGVRIIARERRQ